MRRGMHLFRILEVGFGLVMACAAAWGSIDRGSIRGTLTDAQGGVIPGVQVTITNTETGVQQTTRTNSAGFYFVPELVPGKYTVHFDHAGFVPMDITNIVVKADGVATVDGQLQVGRTTQTVEVKAAVPLVETTASNFSVGIEQHYVADLPIEGRDIQGIVQMIPGVTQSNGPPGTLVGFNGGQFGGFPDPSHILGSQLSINGAQSSANVWYLEGALNSAEGVDQAVVNPQPDAVSEFQAITNGFAAEYGRTAGGVFNVVLKSGTNAVHGDLYEFNRNSYFESRNPFAATDPFGHTFPPNYVNLNQFGGTIGGPVVIPHIYHGKNRTFFFAAWDLSRLIEKAPGALFTVPTLKMRNGDFSEIPSVQQYGIFDPLSAIKVPTSYVVDRTAFGTPIAGDPSGCLASHIQASGGKSCALATSIPTNLIDPVSQWYLNQYPAPNFIDPRQQNAAAGGCLNTCNNYQGNYASGQNTHSVVIKVEHQVSDKNKLFSEFLYNPTHYQLNKLPWVGATVPLVGFNGGFPFDVKNIIATLGDTHSFRPTMINEFRFAYSRESNIPIPVPNSFANVTETLQQLNGLNLPLNPPYDPVPTWSVGGLAGFGASINPLIQATQAATFQDNLTVVHSKHTIKTGIMFRTDITGTILPSELYLSAGGGLTNNPITGSGGYGVAQFLSGAIDNPPGTSQYRITPSTIGSNHTWSFFVQDDYRVSSKLTVNVGLRYDMYGWFDDRHNNASLFYFDTVNPLDPVRKGAINYFVTARHPSRRAYPPNYTDFGPRLNFAYSPFADRKTVIRAGIDYIYTNGQTMVNGQAAGASEDPGYQQFVSYTTDATGQGLNGSGLVPAFILHKGAPNLPPYLDPKANDTQLLGIQGGGALTYPKLPRDPNVLFWNFQVQRELPWNLAVTAGYVGSKSTDLLGGRTYFNFVPTAVELQYRSQLNNYVPMPADLVPYFGSTYHMSQIYMQFPQYTGISGGGGSGTGGSSHYNGFVLKVDKRFSQGLNFVASYTAQKNIADAGIGGYFSNTWTGGANWGNGRGRQFQLGASSISNNGGGQNPDNWKADRSLASDDIPQIFNLAWTYELPFGPGKPFASSAHGVVRQVVQGWKFSGSFNAQTGVPLAISGPCNPLEAVYAPAYGCRPNLIDDPQAGRGSKNRYQLEHGWFKPNAFEAVYGSDPAIIALATSGTPAQKDAHNEFWRFGTAGFRLPGARSPSFWDMDAAFTKDFKISEARYFQFRAEAYNALNHQSLGIPNTGWCLPPNPDGSTDAVHQFGCQFGWIGTVQRDPRAFEFGLKFVF